MRKITDKLLFLRKISDFRFKNVLFFIGIVLLVYLVAGCMLDTVQESHARGGPVIAGSE